MLEKIQTIVLDSLADVVEEKYSQIGGGSEEDYSVSLDTKIYGSKALLDSLSLVSLVIDIEEKISEEFSKSIVIADEKAMSQTTSPFKDVKSLVAYIYNLLQE